MQKGVFFYSSMANLKTSKGNRLELKMIYGSRLVKFSQGGIYYVKTLKDKDHIKFIVSYFYFILYFRMNSIHLQLMN